MGVTQPARGLATLQPAVYEFCGIGPCPDFVLFVVKKNPDRKPSAREATPLRNEVEQAKNKIWSVGNRFPQFSGPGPAPRGSDDLTSAFADRRADPIHPNY